MASALTPNTAPDPVERSTWQRWVGFWFPASDPVTLGFIRVCTGLLVLYIHLAYSVDLQQFFGKQGWYSQQFVDRERREYPWQASPFWSWDPQSIVPAKVPDFPHRRKAVVDFIRALPEEEPRRRDGLRFVERLSNIDNPEVTTLALLWVRKMQTAPLRDQALARVIVDPPALPSNQLLQELIRLGNYPSVDYPPVFFLGLPLAERQKLVEEVRAFWDVLPPPALNDGALDTTAREYVLAHFTEMTADFRRAFLQFVYDLPADKAQREKKTEYLDYWNNEPEKAVRTGHPIFSVWFHVTDPTQMALIHVGILLLIVLFIVGLFTRVTSVLVWLAVVGYIHRTQQVLFGMDTMMNILLFYLMIGNSGAALSLDRLINRYRAARASLRRSGTIDEAARVYLFAPPPSKSAGFALRLIQVHFCFIYVAAGLAKLKGGAWWNGQAFWDVVVNPEFTLMQYQWYETALRAVASIKPVYYAMAAGGVWFTLFIEIAGPFLLWTRLRWLIIFLATLMHAIIGVMMGLNLFELLMIIMLLAFLPDGVIRDRLRGGPDLPKLSFAFGPSALSARAAALVAAADTDSQVALAPDPALATPSATDPNGKKLTGPDGVTALFRSVRLLSMLSFVLWVPGVKGLLTARLFPAPASAAPPTTSAPSAPAAAS